MKIHPVIAVLAFCLLVVSVAIVTGMVERGPEHFFSSAASPAPEEHSPPRFESGIFHEPQTAAERALDKIIRMSVAHPELFPVVLQNPKYDLSRSKEYERLFTGNFLSAWRRYDKANCGKKENCEYDLNPVICTNNDFGSIREPFRYRTVMGDRQEAYLSLVHATDPPPDEGASKHPAARLRHFYLRFEQGRWKLAWLTCYQGDPDLIPYRELIEKFWQPRFKSEKKLDEIFRALWSDVDGFSFVFSLAGRNPEKDGKFSGLFTRAFLRSAKERARDMVDPPCLDSGGRACTDLNLRITCYESEADIGIWYSRTTHEEANHAVIVYSAWEDAYAYPLYPANRFEYRMKRDEAGWKLDGFGCGETRPSQWRINFPYFCYLFCL